MKVQLAKIKSHGHDNENERGKNRQKLITHLALDTATIVTQGTGNSQQLGRFTVQFFGRFSRIFGVIAGKEEKLSSKIAF